MNGLDILMRDTLAFWSEYISHAEVTHDGKTERFEIFKRVVEKDNVRFIIYLDADVGKLQRADLYNENGEVVRWAESSLDRAPEGLALVFKWTLTIKEEVAM